MDRTTVGSVMTRNVVTAVPATPFRELVARMAEHGVSALPVVDPQGRPIGVVSEADVLAKQEFHGGQDELPHHDRTGRERWYRAQGRIAAEVMTTPVRAVHADEPVVGAAQLLAKAGIRRLFVIDGDGRLIGVVSRRDLLHVYLCDDEELRTRIVELLAKAGFTPGAVAVRVADGVATVDGSVAGPGAGIAALRLVRAVPGVVGVHDNLSFPVDEPSERMWIGTKP
ncbi:CBS domain-containing protein [Actinophytocola sp.]|uniref:CBS domain-containing protein n=1 Tax=Actinophytocola sp. TaxID=1872138 RepID=UPI002D2D482D|nr:CBS domain-containing protein [Actinophytocola sp.]HYQ63978.1 CBS domain-containing protein [Actinophytocola sp.]